MRDWIDIMEEASHGLLKHFIEAKVNFLEADFWITRRGTPEAVGKPTSEFSPEHIGVKVTATDRLDPQYLHYVVEYLWMQGEFRKKATGSTRLVNIKVSDVLNITVSFQA